MTNLTDSYIKLAIKMNLTLQKHPAYNIIYSQELIDEYRQRILKKRKERFHKSDYYIKLLIVMGDRYHDLKTKYKDIPKEDVLLQREAIVAKRRIKQFEKSIL